ncbi:tripartite ATP-independent transporter DctM subunit [Novosphingobium sp. SG751A]|uniref:TRAP transporter large permease n=1 Tax=Novosphingobium sp. SG751A TaxID=2587000 RepID=UPI001554EEE0|nr:TRAP transporter large permease [Novosphingobium sp. SG751A]NOW46300.1 tripartite ATP-independent transporter DctM subunit [Novosphingobium sp. SG751A]
MSPELIGGIGIVLLLAMLAGGVPIGIGLMLAGIGGMAVMIAPEAALIKAGVVSYEVISKYELGVLPLFLLMAHICFAAGASRDFFAVAARFVGHRRGGLALASIGGCAGFGAISGSSLATVATISSVALPEMRKAGYNPGFAAGALAAGGTLGSLVPPSGALIVFGIIAEQSIGKLFAASLIPVATQAISYLITIIILCTINPALGPASTRATWGERLRALAKIADIVTMITFVIGGLMIGWFTPTEAASVGVVASLGLLALRGGFTIAALRQSAHATLRTAGMIYVIIIGAMLFATFISITGITEAMSGAVIGLHASPVLAIVVMTLVLLLLGSFLDGVALMLLTTPIFLPIAEHLGYSPIWFGIFLVRTMELGFVHPPLGLNIYVLQGVAKDLSLGTIFRGVIPFLVADFFHLAAIIAFPAMALWLPKMMGA